jgi:hypothetical protein
LALQEGFLVVGLYLVDPVEGLVVWDSEEMAAVWLVVLVDQLVVRLVQSVAAVPVIY